MGHVRVNARVVTDQTGRQYSIPIILIQSPEGGRELAPLVDYLIQYSEARSRSWMAKVCQAVELLLDYMNANQGSFDDPVEMFQSFAQRLHSGTIGEDGLDP